MEIRLSSLLVYVAVVMVFVVGAGTVASLARNDRPPPPTATVALPTPTVTWTPMPTPTLGPTATKTPTPVPAAAVSALTRPPRTNLRAGPGLDFPVLAVAPAGTSAEIVAVGPDAGWLLVRVADAPGLVWVYADLVDLSGSLDGVPRLTAEQAATLLEE